MLHAPKNSYNKNSYVAVKLFQFHPMERNANYDVSQK